MKYVVGTGRCGTKSIAIQMNGLHEPYPSINSESLEYYRSGFASTTLLEKLKYRSELKTNLISDNKQSLVIDLISKVDPNAHFIWLIRNPHDCIKSFLERGHHDKSGRIMPKDGFGHLDYDDNLSRLCWFWNEKNELIRKYLEHESYEVIFTDELKVKSHESNNPKKLTKKERNTITEKCGNLWDFYRGMKCE